jgi:hypothetical protein
MQTIEFTFPAAGSWSRWTTLLDTGRTKDFRREFAAGARLQALPRSTLAFSGTG